jgi:O-antigen/teichoic acid export membrane protein
MSPPELAAGVVEQPQIDAGPTAHAELEATEVRRLALRGFGALVIRSIGQRGLQVVGNVLLARWLAPTTFGLYAIVSFIIGTAGFLSDLGVGASLVQRKERLRERDLRTAFSLTLTLNVMVVAIVMAIAGPLVRAYDLAPSNVLAIRALALTILISSFTAIPAIRLERALRFRELSVADLAGQLAYVAVAVPLAFRFRAPSFAEAHAQSAVWCFVWGSIASRCVHAILINVTSPWRPRLGMNAGQMRQMLSFGLPFQLNTFVNVLKDNFIPTFIAFAAGARAVGYVTWAVGLVANALFLMPLVSRVSFPAFSRLQHDPPALKDAIERSIRWVAATVFPATLFLAALARQIVEHVYGPKWQAGLVSFYFLCVPILASAYSTVMVSALYALGRARTVLKLTTIWAIVGWALAVPAVLWFGYHGFALAMALVSTLSILTVRELNKIVRVRFVPPLLKILVLAAIPAAGMAAVSRFVVHDVASLAVLAGSGGIAYLVLMAATGELREVRAMIHRRRVPQPVSEAVVDHA